MVVTKQMRGGEDERDDGGWLADRRAVVVTGGSRSEKGRARLGCRLVHEEERRGSRPAMKGARR
jgi:hypothetical protein